jgi:hypothetical protein
VIFICSTEKQMAVGGPQTPQTLESKKYFAEKKYILP